MEFPTLQPPSNIQHRNPSGKYLNPSAYEIPLGCALSQYYYLTIYLPHKMDRPCLSDKQIFQPYPIQHSNDQTTYRHLNFTVFTPVENRATHFISIRFNI